MLRQKLIFVTKSVVITNANERAIAVGTIGVDSYVLFCFCLLAKLGIKSASNDHRLG